MLTFSSSNCYLEVRLLLWYLTWWCSSRLTPKQSTIAAFSSRSVKLCRSRRDLYRRCMRARLVNLYISHVNRRPSIWRRLVMHCNYKVRVFTTDDQLDIYKDQHTSHRPHWIRNYMTSQSQIVRNSPLRRNLDTIVAWPRQPCHNVLRFDFSHAVSYSYSVHICCFERCYYVTAGVLGPKSSFGNFHTFFVPVLYFSITYLTESQFIFKAG